MTIPKFVLILTGIELRSLGCATTTSTTRLSPRQPTVMASTRKQYSTAGITKISCTEHRTPDFKRTQGLNLLHSQTWGRYCFEKVRWIDCLEGRSSESDVHTRASSFCAGCSLHSCTCQWLQRNIRNDLTS
jgi:hypothetical protein